MGNAKRVRVSSAWVRDRVVRNHGAWGRDRVVKFNFGLLSAASIVAYLDDNLDNDADTAYTLTGQGADITYTTGKYDNCYSATLHNGIKSSDDIIVALTGDLSMSCWFKIESNGLSPNPQWRRIMWYMDNSRYVGFEVDYTILATNNKLRLEGANVGGSTQTTVGTYNDGNWHFAVMVKSGTTLSVLIDNSVLLSTSTTLTGTITYAPTISAYSPDYPLNGYIDQWCLWDYALSTDECASLYNNDNDSWRRVNL